MTTDRLYLTMRSRTFCYFVIVVVSAIVNLLWYMNKGIMYPTDSKFFISQADLIFENGLSYYVEHLSTPYYWGYPTFIAIVRPWGGDAGVVFLQMLFSFLSVCLLFKLISQLSDSNIIALICSAFYAVLFEVFQWNIYFISDSFGMSVEIITLYFFYKIWSGKRVGHIDSVKFIAAALIFFTVRTNATSLILPLCILYLFALIKRNNINPKYAFAALAMFALLCISGLLYAGTRSNDLNQYSLQSLLSLFKHFYDEGIIVYDRPRLNHDNIDGASSLVNAVVIVLKRLFYYFSLWFKEYSLGHKIINTLQILPIWCLSAISVAYIIKDKNEDHYPTIIGAACYAMFQVPTALDFDLRYRSPVFCLLVICCSYGLKNLIGNFTKSK